MDFNNDDGVVDPLAAVVDADEETTGADAEPTEVGEAEEDESPVSVYDMNEDGELEPA